MTHLFSTQHIQDPHPLRLAFIKSALASPFHPELAASVKEFFALLETYRKKLPNFVSQVAHPSTDPKWINFLGEHRSKDFTSMDAFIAHLRRGQPNAFTYFARFMPHEVIREAVIFNAKSPYYLFAGDFIECPRTLNLWASMEQAFQIKTKPNFHGYHLGKSIVPFSIMLKQEADKDPLKRDLVTRIEEHLFQQSDLSILLEYAPVEHEQFYLRVCLHELGKRFSSVREPTPPTDLASILDRIFHHRAIDRFVGKYPIDAQPVKNFFDVHFQLICQDSTQFFQLLGEMIRAKELLTYLPNFIANSQTDHFHEAMNQLEPPYRTQIEHFLLSQDLTHTRNRAKKTL